MFQSNKFCFDRKKGDPKKNKKQQSLQYFVSNIKCQFHQMVKLFNVPIQRNRFNKMQESLRYLFNKFKRRLIAIEGVFLFCDISCNHAYIAY